MENSRVSYDSIHSVDKDAEALKDLRRRLNLDFTPMVIEGFDISTLQGEQNVASMVRFVNGRPDKAGYRKFKIKTVEGIDDYASMNEVVTRRYKRLLSENKTLPDLILIDGGPGQLGSAQEALESVGLFDQSIIALAKREELIYTPGGGEPLRLSDNSPALNLVKRIRDEAHRFAIKFQKDTRKAKIQSSLEEIPGIGPATRKKLLLEFQSIQKIKSLSLDDLKNVLDNKKAETVYNYYHPDQN
jgi:excinuclease ABC subunit C